MNRIFVIGDTHFGHSNVIRFQSAHRPFQTIEEHDEALVERWNATVKPKDTVWHLGDVLFGQEAFKTLARLNGRKKLIMGNHDQYSTQSYLEYFDKCYGAAKVRDCILTHIPVHPSQFYRFKYNIHGHLHSSALDDRRYINVSAEHTGLAPVLLDFLLTERNRHE